MKEKKQSPIERRGEVRIESCISARIWALGNPIPAFTKDISASGIKFQVTSPCRFVVGERYRMEIELPKEDQTIHTYGKIIRIDEDGKIADRWRIALQFTDIRPDDQAKIRKFVYRRELERHRLDLK